ncbi:MAG: HAD family hydrolase [Treponema sp.]|nr:HAD family hydrolase [Treponema sp.]
MSIKDFKAVIFDFDGTLYDNTGIAKAMLLGNPFRFFYMKAERNTRRALKGRDFDTPQNFKDEYYKRAAPQAFCKPEKFAYWYEKRYLRRMARTLSKKQFRAHPKVYEVFKKLSDQGIKIALYSDYNDIKERALSCGISQEALDLCQGFYSSETMGCLKPAPRGFLQIAANLGTRPKDCLVVGDRDDTDGFGARLTEMQFVQIRTRRPKEVLSFNHPIMSWEDFAAEILGKK